MMPDMTGVWSNESASLEKLQRFAIKLPVPFPKAGCETMGTGKLNHGRNGGEWANLDNLDNLDNLASKAEHRELVSRLRGGL